jgi:hypothetical protein
MFFILNSRKDHYAIKPVINGLFDHDAQLIVISNIKPVAIISLQMQTTN